MHPVFVLKKVRKICIQVANNINDFIKIVEINI